MIALAEKAADQMSLPPFDFVRGRKMTLLLQNVSFSELL